MGLRSLSPCSCTHISGHIMEISIYSLLGGAELATGAVAVIDVFRAFTTAAVALANGAACIVTVGVEQRTTRKTQLFAVGPAGSKRPAQGAPRAGQWMMLCRADGRPRLPAGGSDQLHCPVFCLAVLLPPMISIVLFWQSSVVPTVLPTTSSGPVLLSARSVP